MKADEHGVYNAPGDIAVLGDIHGDYGALTSALKAGGLIQQVHEWNDDLEEKEDARRRPLKRNDDGIDYRESKYSLEIKRWKWIGGNTYLVILGDMVDRWRKPEDKDKCPGHSFGEFAFEEEVIQRVSNELRTQAEEYGGKVISRLRSLGS
jgi:hypothetical protein